MNMLLATLVFALALDSPKGMQPRVLMGDSSHCDAVMVRDGHLSIEEVCLTSTDGRRKGAQIAWDGHVVVITQADEKASADWIRSPSLLARLTTQHHDLYWDGKKVDLGRVDVFDLYEAIPWQSGILIYGRTIPRRRFWESWPFKGDFIEARDIEPFCAIYFDPNTLKGEDLYINGKAYRGLFVFPIPD
ncbi:MAG TPA: hypothetical protein VJW96_08925 [Terriglobales bacterium]|nr:hypothetical protein [Terriglobales bacterium]